MPVSVAFEKAADLGSFLEGEGYYTVFAPTDEAFSNLPAGTLEEWMNPANREKLASIIKNHVVLTKVDVTREGETYLVSAGGHPLTLSREYIAMSDIMLPPSVGEAVIVTQEIDAANGAIFGIDRVLVP
jgi:uncharacterized surface protein with fasciclin (FAS1) repeats